MDGQSKTVLSLGVYPKLCVTLYRCEIEQNIIKGGSGLVRCRLVCSITLTGTEVKGGEAVHLPLTYGSGSVTRAFGRQRRSTTERGSGSNPVGGQSTFL